jgi:uncharacterized protein DUF6272
MNEGEVILTYKGDITADLITDVLEIFESKIDQTKSKTRKKIYNVLVECLQNLYHHSEEIENELKNNGEGKFAVFVLSKHNDSYRISTGNFVKKNKINVLTNKMDKINALSEDEVRSLYKVILNNQDFTEKGGGGLGMIDIVRKTGSKLDYEFYDFTNEISFFNLNINIT